MEKAGSFERGDVYTLTSPQGTVTKFEIMAVGEKRIEWIHEQYPRTRRDTPEKLAAWLNGLRGMGYTVEVGR